MMYFHSAGALNMKIYLIIYAFPPHLEVCYLTLYVRRLKTWLY